MTTLFGVPLLSAFSLGSDGRIPPSAHRSPAGSVRPRSPAGQGLVHAAVIAAVLAMGCKKADSAPPPGAPAPSGTPAAAAEPVDADSRLPSTAPSAALQGTPAELYGACRERVETPETDGECKTDADCVQSGCSQELCISVAASAEGIMSTCEVRPCFAVLDACGCQAGRCSWSLKDLPAGATGLPGMGIPVTLPPKDGGGPPTQLSEPAADDKAPR